MTARGRGKKVGTKNDFYPTPKWAIDRFLEEWPTILNPEPMHWLDCGAGYGAIIEAVNEFRAERGLYPIKWTAIELRPICEEKLRTLTDDVRIMDFANARVRTIRPHLRKREIVPGANARPHRYDVAIYNPPFPLTMRFLARSLKVAAESAVLQRQNFIGSAERNGFFRGNMPDQFMIPDRVDFSGDGKGDAIGHSWFRWGPHPPVSTGELVLLKTTPNEVRKSCRPRIPLNRPIPTQKIKRVRRRKRKKSTSKGS